MVPTALCWVLPAEDQSNWHGMSALRRPAGTHLTFLSAVSSLKFLCCPCLYLNTEVCSPGLGIRLSNFRANRLFFAQKWANERFAQKKERFTQKKERFTHLLIFGERPEPFAHHRSFPLNDLSDSLTSLTKKEEMSDSLIFSINKKKIVYKTYEMGLLDQWTVDQRALDQ